MFAIEQSVKMGITVKSALTRDVVYRIRRGFQEIFCLLNLQAVCIFKRSHMIFIFKNVNNMIFAEMKSVAQHFQRNIVGVFLGNKITNLIRCGLFGFFVI